MLADCYSACFADCDLLQRPACREEVEHAWHIYLVRLRNEALAIDRDGVIEALREANIGTSVHFIPLHLHPYYREHYGYQAGDFPVADDVFARCLSLPLFSSMSEAEVERTLDVVLEVAKEFAV